jgi:septum formation protein
MFYLASASPRRTELLTYLGVEHHIKISDVPEVRLSDETALAYGYRVSMDKALAVQACVSATDWVLAADTEVLVDDQTLGKPEDEAHFMQMMRRLSGKMHAVQTVIALVQGERRWQTHQLSFLTFRALSDDELRNYWASGEPVGKAGGYAIQGKAARWVSQFFGSHSGVMGLPLYECDQLLTLAGWTSCN